MTTFAEKSWDALVTEINQIAKQAVNWQIARPKLILGGCPYGRRLLYQLLYRLIELKNRDRSNPELERYVKIIRRKLGQRPPSTDPPSSGSSFM